MAHSVNSLRCNNSSALGVTADIRNVLSLVVHAQGDDEHVAVLVVDERAPELVHAGSSVLEVDVTGQRNARGVEAE